MRHCSRLEFLLASYSRGIPSVIRVLEFERDASSIPSTACECDVALNLYCSNSRSICKYLRSAGDNVLETNSMDWSDPSDNWRASIALIS